MTQQEDVSQCRDANEEHGLGFDDIGCDPQFRASQLNKPIPENDDICWEVQRFGATEEGEWNNRKDMQPISCDVAWCGIEDPSLLVH